MMEELRTGAEWAARQMQEARNVSPGIRHEEQLLSHQMSAVWELNKFGQDELYTDDTHRSFEEAISSRGYFLKGLDGGTDPQIAFQRLMTGLWNLWWATLDMDRYVR